MVHPNLTYHAVLSDTAEQMTGLMALWNDRGRASGDVKKIAAGHIEALENKMRELQDTARALRHLVDHCHGDDRPDCPIIEELAGTPGAGQVPSKGHRHLGKGFEVLR